jgi:hypothetical protein
MKVEPEWFTRTVVPQVEFRSVDWNLIITGKSRNQHRIHILDKLLESSIWICYADSYTCMLFIKHVIPDKVDNGKQ